MKKSLNSNQHSIKHNEKILLLFRTLQKDFKEYLFERSKQYGFTGPQIILMFMLYKNPGISLHELSDQMELSKSTVSGIVDRLVNQGIVMREIPEENRRVIRLSLSPDFLNECNLSEIRDEYLADIIKDASPEELDKIIYGLEKLHELMSRNKAEGADGAGEQIGQDQQV
jgi:MarR family transcriptional regulator, organic hydroperoxide resistance regulator